MSLIEGLLVPDNSVDDFGNGSVVGDTGDSAVVLRVWWIKVLMVVVDSVVCDSVEEAVI